jgi:hypothetical protein
MERLRRLLRRSHVKLPGLLLIAACGCTITPTRAAANEDGLASRSATGRADTTPASTEDEGAVAETPITRGQLWATWNALRGDAYALDAVERWIPAGQRVTCAREGLVSYRGEVIRYSGSVLINPAFRERLARFEQVVAEVARETYGREPVRIRHYGAFSCRPTRKRARLTSEHALGNALDVVGFDFGPATKAKPLTDGLARELRGSFQVRVARHWSAAKGTAAVHARFLAVLTERLRARDDIFRSMFGPGHGGHDDHLHLDVSPWRYVDL